MTETVTETQTVDERLSTLPRYEFREGHAPTVARPDGPIYAARVGGGRATMITRRGDLVGWRNDGGYHPETQAILARLGVDRSEVSMYRGNINDFGLAVPLTAQQKYEAMPEVRVVRPSDDTSSGMVADWSHRTFRVTSLEPALGMNIQLISPVDSAPDDFNPLLAFERDGFTFTTGEARDYRQWYIRPSAVELVSTGETVPEVPLLKMKRKALLAQVEAMQATWEKDVQAIAGRLNYEAEERGWCDDYDSIILDLNRALTVKLPKRRTMVTRPIIGTVSRESSYNLRVPDDATQGELEDAYRVYVQSRDDTATVSNIRAY